VCSHSREFWWFRWIYLQSISVLFHSITTVRSSWILLVVEWDEEDKYKVQPPQYICYTIEWKLTLNYKKVGGETAKGLVVAPHDYWKNSPKNATEDML
jgi:hypothetical protein